MIRLGAKEDLPAIVAMAEEFWSHTIYDEPYCPDSVEIMAEMCIDNKLLCVLEVDDKVHGFACAVKGALLGNAKITSGTEIAWWVDPDYRKGRHGIELLINLERLAKQAGIKYWNMIFMESSMPEAIEGIYQKLGYNRSEVVYTKVL